MYERIISFLAQGKVDLNYLHGVKKGFSGSGVLISWWTVLYFFLILAALILLIILLRRWIKPAKYRVAKWSSDIIKDPKRIHNIIERSITLRAVYDMEILDEDYQELYRGQVLGINPENELEVELSSYIDPSKEFKDKDIQVSFRMSRRGKQEFYRFNTVTKYLDVTTRYGRREKAVRLAMPKEMEKSQKRRHIRVEPVGPFRFKVRLLECFFNTEPVSVSRFTLLHHAEVSDISTSGLQAVITARYSELSLAPDQTVFINFRLPVNDLEMEHVPGEFLIQAKVVSVVRRPTGRRVMSKKADERIVGPNMVGLEYTAKGHINRQEKTVTFRPATSLVFEDLARWIQAYQRYMIQKERGTLRKPDVVKNRYPRFKPKVEPKYPSEPLEKKTD